jgi:hypothetical protein
VPCAGERGQVGGDGLRIEPGVAGGLHHARHPGLWIEHCQRRRMVDAVLVRRRARGSRHLHEHQRQRARERFERGEVGGGRQRVLVERMRVFADAVRRVAIRIHGDEQHPRSRRLGQRSPRLLRLGESRERGRADVRAMREAEEDKGPVALQFARNERRAVGLLQRERRQHPGLLEQPHDLQLRPGRFRRKAVLRGPEGESGRQRGDQDDKGGPVEHGAGLLQQVLELRP